MASSWISSSLSTPVECICVGTGRFLRSVLVPALSTPPVLIQPRGSSFLSSPQPYPVDTVQVDGSVETTFHDCRAVFSWATESHRESLYDWLQATDLSNIQLVGIGVTEAGLQSSEILQHLKTLLEILLEKTANKICIVNTDNVSYNGDFLHSKLKEQGFSSDRVVCLNSMVDRITAHRTDDTLVPRAEPVPAKPLVVWDPHNDLPDCVSVLFRKEKDAFDKDIDNKLRVANGTHTALAHVLAMMGVLQTTQLCELPLIMAYVDALAKDQILRVLPSEAQEVYDDWRARLLHPHFGLSSFFITQNGAAKGGIRLGPTVVDLLKRDEKITVSMALAFAFLLRWLTPTTPSDTSIFRGKLDVENLSCDDTTEYADGLRYNMKEQWYEFRCACTVGPDSENLSSLLQASPIQHASGYEGIIRSYLVSLSGGDIKVPSGKDKAFDEFVSAIAILYARLRAGESCSTLLSDVGALKTTGWATPCALLKSSL